MYLSLSAELNRQTDFTVVVSLKICSAAHIYLDVRSVVNITLSYLFCNTKKESVILI